jgi:hypothetical protein
MPPPPNDALVDHIGRPQFDALVKLYDRFAHAIDPHDPEADKAEAAFNDELSIWYDRLPEGPKPPFRDFRKAVIWRCKQQIVRSITKPRAV